MPRDGLLGILREPVLAETRAHLARSRARVLPQYRDGRQMLGRQGNGCGATIGVMPRCDFACRGCYLGDGANHVPPASLDDVKRQIDALRPVLGNAGNLQLTDGEVTLRPAEDVIALLRHAQSVGLVPMLMTHGDSFRRQPGLLERYMVEGGLREVSIHVDTTQRGRKGAAWRGAYHERDLNPLRDEFAAMIRSARASTGLPLRAATTMTVTRENLAGVADVVRWLASHGDAFRLISFQPIAQVGRTEDGLGGGVDVESLWREVAIGLAMDPGALAGAQQWLGHPACNRFVHGIVVTERRSGLRRFLPVRDPASPVSAAIVDEFLDRFGGVTFRRDGLSEVLARVAALLFRAPGFFLTRTPKFAMAWLRRIDPAAPWHAALDVVTGSRRLTGLAIVSHHFMSPSQANSGEGRERIDQCVFHVSVDGSLRSMCEVNALGHREALYAQLSARPRARLQLQR